MSVTDTSVIKLILIAPLILLAGCSTVQTPDPRDPYESFNRSIFAINDGLDRVILKPVAQGYRFVTPDPLEKGVTNVFNNIGDVGNTANSLLQGKVTNAGKDFSRFLINSTLGLVGLFDVASEMGIAPDDGEDFGQTLAVWGVPQGPYLMLPLAGPSTMRDAPAKFIDRYTTPTPYMDHVPSRNSYTATDVIDTRAGLLESEKLIQGDRYILIRDVYLQRREFLVNDGEVEDDFGDLDDY